MTTTPNYGFPLIAESQTNKFLTHNDAILMIDTTINGISLIAIPTAGLVYSDGSALQTATVDPTLSYTSGVIAVNLAHTNAWTKSQRATPATLSASGSIAVDLSLSNNFTTTLTGTASLANPSNANAGQSGVIVIKQDATGSRTMTFGGNWKFAGGTDPTLSTAANAVDLLSYYVIDSTHIAASFAANFS